MVTLKTEVLQPLQKLQRIELKNDYWQCDPPFIAVESWILSHGITYEQICKEKRPRMFEKIISAVTEREEVDVNDVWNITTNKNDSVVPVLKPTTPLTPFQKFDKEFSSFQALILGMEIGLGLGIVGTYIWLRSFCRCSKWSCTRPKSRRERRRERRADAEIRRSLLWTTVIHPDMETPPVFRRQLSDEISPYPTYGLPGVVEAGLQIDAVRLPDRAETPPPAYNECRMLYGT